MKNLNTTLFLTVSKIDRRHLQFALMVISLGLFVLGAGAPDGDGGIGIR